MGYFLGFGTLCLLSVLRFDVGWDYFAYWLVVVPFGDSFIDILFADYSQVLDYSEFNRLELFFRFLYYVTDTMGWRALFFIVTGTLTYLFIFGAVKHSSKDIYSAFFVYLAFHYLLSLGGVRQALAVAIILYSIRYIIEQKILAFIAFIFIAGLAHRSAWLMVLLYPLYYMFSLKTLAICCFVLIALAQIVKSFLFSLMKYSAYDGMDMQGGSIMIWLNIGIFMAACYFVFNYSHKEELESNIRLLKIVLVGLIFPFIFGGQIGIRISAYFNIFYVLLFSNVLRIPFERQRILRTCFNFLCCAYLLFSIYWSSRSEQKSPYTPYRCVLFTDTSVWKDGTFDDVSQAYLDRVL